MKRIGNVQIVFKSTPTHKERNIVHGFTGLLGLIKQLWKAYKQKPDKVMIFFEK